MSDKPIDTVPEDDELMMEDEEGFAEDMLLSVLTTDEGESITSVLANLAASTDAISKHLEKQNVILVKILTALTAKSSIATAASP
jgi:hypothetical protein